MTQEVTEKVPLTPPPTPILEEFKSTMAKKPQPLMRSALEEKLVQELKLKRLEEDQKIKAASLRIEEQNSQLMESKREKEKEELQKSQRLEMERKEEELRESARREEQDKQHRQQEQLQAQKQEQQRLQAQA